MKNLNLLITVIALSASPALAEEAAAPAAAKPATKGAKKAKAEGAAPAAEAPVTKIGLAASEAYSYTRAERACTGSENWNFGKVFGANPLNVEKQKDFDRFLSGRQLPVQAFAEGIALRRFAETDETRVFGEYWISRALMEANLVHPAYNGFAVIASRPVTPETAGIQTAALECLTQIHLKNPTFNLPADAVQNLKDFVAHGKAVKYPHAAWEAASAALRMVSAPPEGVKRKDPVPSDAAEFLLSVLKGAGARESFARGVWASRLLDHKTAASSFAAFFTQDIPASHKRFVDYAHILNSRALYSIGKYTEAAAEFKLVSKASNELASSLSELAWAFLMDEKYPEAIGTAMNLNVGGMSKTFAPEAPMVMAMALNELCQYPESTHSIGIFRKNYEKPYRWLAGWKEAKGGVDLYREAVKFLRRQSDVPGRVAGEWARSPLFQAAQGELNLLIDERDAAARVAGTGSRQQVKLATDIVLQAKTLHPKVKYAKTLLKPGQALPSQLNYEIGVLRKNISQLRRLQLAAPVFKAVLASHRQVAPAIEKTLLARINQDFAGKNERMLSQLEEIAENVQLIEVEIYNGASQDIIWQNAHPDYKEIAQKMRDEHEEMSAAQTLDWGRSPAGDDEENAEVWEDELGSFKATLYDNCSSKDKYRQVKLKRGKS